MNNEVNLDGGVETRSRRREEGGEVIGLMLTMGRTMEGMQKRLAEACSLNLPCFHLLSMASEKKAKGITVSEAAEVLCIKPQALSGAAGQMSREGLLKREVDKKDARARRLRITGKGEKRLEKGNQLKEILVGEILERIPQPSVARLVLDRLKEALENGHKMNGGETSQT